MFSTKELNILFGGKFTVDYKDHTNNRFGTYHKNDGCVYFKHFRAAKNCARRLRKMTATEYVEANVTVYVTNLRGYADGIYTIDHAGYGDVYELVAA